MHIFHSPVVILAVLAALLAILATSNTTTETSELTVLKKRTFYELQRKRWWYKSRFRSNLHCAASTLFVDDVSQATAVAVSVTANQKKSLFHFPVGVCVREGRP